MSTIQQINFEFCSNILGLEFRSMPVEPGQEDALIHPLSATALVGGEWVTRVASKGDFIQRATDITTVGAEPSPINTLDLFPAWTERGRTDVQATNQVPFPYLGEWAADTRIFDATAVVGGTQQTPTGAAITFVGQGLKVATISLGGRNYSGLVGHGGAADPATVVVVVDRLPTMNGGKLRVRKR